jgi:hypothetical protein
VSAVDLAAWRTLAASVLTDYQRAAETEDTAGRAMWGARLADALVGLLAALEPKVRAIGAIVAAAYRAEDRDVPPELAAYATIGRPASDTNDPDPSDAFDPDRTRPSQRDLDDAVAALIEQACQLTRPVTTGTPRSSPGRRPWRAAATPASAAATRTW